MTQPAAHAIAEPLAAKPARAARPAHYQSLNLGPVAERAITADDVPTAFGRLLSMIDSCVVRDAKDAAKALPGAMASKLRNHAQLALLHAEEWREHAEVTGDEDADRRWRRLEDIAEALTWVAVECEAVRNGVVGLPNASRPFDYPVPWCQRAPMPTNDCDRCDRCGGSGGAPGYTCDGCAGSGQRKGG